MRLVTRILALTAVALLFSVAGAVGGQVYFYHTDPAGTPIAMSDANGNVVWRADYRPFGEIEEETGTADNNKLFVGKEKDDETGLYYFGARYMDDRIGRFISPDPVGPVDQKNGKVNQKVLLNPQRINYYTYALNNPYKYLDPDGMDVWFIGIGAAGFISKSPSPESIRGYASQVSVGIAIDTESKQIQLYKNSGKANQTSDVVSGVGIGVGPILGCLQGSMEDLFGWSRDRTSTIAVISVDSIETESGKTGTSFSGGGKGWGLGHMAIDTYTSPLLPGRREDQPSALPQAAPSVEKKSLLEPR